MTPEIDISVFQLFPELESERLLFREISVSHLNDFFLLRTDDDVMRFMDITRFNSIEEAEKMISHVSNDFVNKKGITWAIIDKESNEFIGYFGFWRLIAEHCRAEIGYALKPFYWGKGIMTETLKVLIDFGFKNMKLHSIEANVNPANISSIKLLEKAGFQKEAHFKENYLFNGRFLDSYIFSLLEKNFKR